jgi:cob(I)alamin adenosyltransferase
MGYRLSKIVTRTGDDGNTQIGVGKRIAKNHIVIETLGALDELNSTIGLLLAHKPKNKNIVKQLLQVQHDLFNMGGELCPPNKLVITPDKIIELEKMIDRLNATLPPLKEFILPGGNILSATCHLARTICRRTERCFVTLKNQYTINVDSLRYLNRLSDFLFVAARILAKQTKSSEILWKHKKRKD